MGSQIQNSPLSSPDLGRGPEENRRGMGGAKAWQTENGPRGVRAAGRVLRQLRLTPPEVGRDELLVPGLSGDNRVPYWRRQ